MGIRSPPIEPRKRAAKFLCTEYSSLCIVQTSIFSSFKCFSRSMRFQYPIPAIIGTTSIDSAYFPFEGNHCFFPSLVLRPSLVAPTSRSGLIGRGIGSKLIVSATLVPFNPFLPPAHFPTRCFLSRGILSGSF